jgi:predicted nucleic acid-binding protein
MILVDSTVFIDYLRKKDRKLFNLMKQHGGAVCGIIRAEVLHGARDPKDRRRIVAALNALDQISIPDALWDMIGDNLARLRASGLTVPFNDAAIATVAIFLDVEVWARD